MAGQRPREAVENFIAPIQQAVACVAPAYVNVRGGYSPEKNPNAFVLNDGEPIVLRTSITNRAPSLSVTHGYNIVEAEGERGPWKVSTIGYIYQVLEDGEPLVEYHWHPFEGWELTFPHFHFRAADAERPNLSRLHLPTRRIMIEDLLRLLIREFGVEPLRDDWQEIFQANEGKFERWRTWG